MVLRTSRIAGNPLNSKKGLFVKKFLAFVAISIVSFSSSGQLEKKTEMIKVNGIDMYFEIYGEGEPLFLLHGWTLSSQFWSEYIPAYLKNFKVYAIDLRGHGRTSPVTSDFTIKKSSGDILALLNHLKLKKVKAIGLSYGALTLLELASSHPEKIESMILIGASHNFKGGENTNTSFSFEDLPSSFVENLKDLHQHGESQIRAMFNPNLNFQIRLSDEELKKIASKTLIVHGDRDEVIEVEHAIALYKNLPNAALWIVPNTGHLAITGTNFDDFLEKSLRFLRKK